MWNFDAQPRSSLNVDCLMQIQGAKFGMGCHCLHAKSAFLIHPLKGIQFKNTCWGLKHISMNAGHIQCIEYSVLHSSVPVNKRVVSAYQPCACARACMAQEKSGLRALHVSCAAPYRSQMPECQQCFSMYTHMHESLPCFWC